MKLADVCDPEEHPTGRVLAEYFAGRLSGAENESIARHIETCPQCKSQTSLAEITPDPGEWARQVAGAVTEISPSTPNRTPVPRGTPSRPPTRIDGFQIQDELGRGGMGRVYRAYDERLKRTVALKLLLAKHEGKHGIGLRFRNEAQAAARLTHAGIVPIYEIGEHDGNPYFTMPLADGGTLANRLADGPLPPREAAELVRQLADAIGFAHERNVIHRDLKPGNILFTQDRPQIADFGLAKLTDEAHDFTTTGDVLGTPQFMAPEQTAGDKAALQSPAVDIYALGAILYAAVTGRPPFQSAALGDLLEAIRQTEPVAPRLLAPKMPRDLETICLKCLEKAPDRRYATARDLADDLGRFLRDEPIRARPVTSWERARRWRRKNPLAANLLAATIAGALLAAAAVSWAVVETRKNTKTATAAIQLVLPLTGEDRYLSGSTEEAERLVKLKECLNTLQSIDGAMGVQGQSRLQAQVTSRIVICNFAIEGANLKKSDLQEAIGRLNAAYRAAPQDEETISDLAEVHTRLGQFSAEWGNSSKADESFQLAVELREKLAAMENSPRRHRYKRLHASALMNVGYLERAQTAREALLKSAPTTELRDLYRDLVKGCLALHDQAEGAQDRHLDEAEAWLEKIGPTLERETCFLKAGLHLRRGQYLLSPENDSAAKAVAEFEQAEPLLLALRNDHPALTKYRVELAKCRLYRGTALRRLSQFDAAFQALTTAVTEFHPLVLENSDARMDLGVSYMELLVLKDGRTLTAEQQDTFERCEKTLSEVFDELGEPDSMKELRRIAQERIAAEGAGAKPDASPAPDNRAQ